MCASRRARCPSLLITYPTPARVAAAPEQVKQLLRAASHGRLSKEAMEGLVKDAQRSLGLPALPEDELAAPMCLTRDDRTTLPETRWTRDRA